MHVSLERQTNASNCEGFSMETGQYIPSLNEDAVKWEYVAFAPLFCQASIIVQDIGSLHQRILALQMPRAVFSMLRSTAIFSKA